MVAHLLLVAGAGNAEGPSARADEAIELLGRFSVPTIHTPIHFTRGSNMSHSTTHHAKPHTHRPCNSLRRRLQLLAAVGSGQVRIKGTKGKARPPLVRFSPPPFAYPFPMNTQGFLSSP